MIRFKHTCHVPQPVAPSRRYEAGATCEASELPDAWREGALAQEFIEEFDPADETEADEDSDATVKPRAAAPAKPKAAKAPAKPKAEPKTKTAKAPAKPGAEPVAEPEADPVSDETGPAADPAANESAE